jgi:predicted amidophosphoribosyltransferase
MSRALCPGCGNVDVPAGNVCWDCCYRTPQERQNEAERLRERLDLSAIYLRDKFALSALQGLRAADPDLTAREFASEAYRLADAMIEARKTGTPS